MRVYADGLLSAVGHPQSIVFQDLETLNDTHLSQWTRRVRPQMYEYTEKVVLIINDSSQLTKYVKISMRNSCYITEFRHRHGTICFNNSFHLARYAQ